MTFEEAQKQIKKGNTIFRKAWNGEKYLEPKEDTNIFHITLEDAKADDWEMIETSKKAEINLGQFTNYANEAATALFQMKPEANLYKDILKELIPFYMFLLTNLIFYKEDK